jgi:hypothetical protein
MRRGGRSSFGSRHWSVSAVPSQISESHWSQDGPVETVG